VQKREFYPEVPHWDTSVVTIISANSFAADGSDVAVDAADADKFANWLDSLKDQGRVFLYGKVFRSDQ
jgi:hypothetical protein